jgi:hypothetical protein
MLVIGLMISPFVMAPRRVAMTGLARSAFMATALATTECQQCV